MTGYQRMIATMSLSDMDRIIPSWWGLTYGVEPEVIIECVEARKQELADIELLKARPEVAE